MSHTPIKRYPDPDRQEIKFPDPDRPEIKFPDPTRPDPKIFFKMSRDRSGLGKLGDSGCPAGLIEAIILCSFDFDLEKKNLKKKSARPPLRKKVVEDNQTIIFFRPYDKY